MEFEASCQSTGLPALALGVGASGVGGMAAAQRHLGHGMTRKSWRERKAAQKAKACPHLLQVVRAKSICDASGANPFSWPLSCPVEPRWLSAGLAELLPLLAAPLDTMRARLPLPTAAARSWLPFRSSSLSPGC